VIPITNKNAQGAFSLGVSSVFMPSIGNDILAGNQGSEKQVYDEIANSLITLLNEEMFNPAVPESHEPIAHKLQHFKHNLELQLNWLSTNGPEKLSNFLNVDAPNPEFDGSEAYHQYICKAYADYFSSASHLDLNQLHKDTVFLKNNLKPHYTEFCLRGEILGHVLTRTINRISGKFAYDDLVIFRYACEKSKASPQSVVELLRSVLDSAMQGMPFDETTLQKVWAALIEARNTLEVICKNEASSSPCLARQDPTLSINSPPPKPPGINSQDHKTLWESAFDLSKAKFWSPAELREKFQELSTKIIATERAKRWYLWMAKNGYLERQGMNTRLLYRLKNPNLT